MPDAKLTPLPPTTEPSIDQLLHGTMQLLERTLGQLVEKEALVAESRRALETARAESEFYAAVATRLTKELERVDNWRTRWSKAARLAFKRIGPVMNHAVEFDNERTRRVLLEKHSEQQYQKIRAYRMLTVQDRSDLRTVQTLIDAIIEKRVADPTQALYIARDSITKIMNRPVP